MNTSLSWLKQWRPQYGGRDKLRPPSNMTNSRLPDTWLTPAGLMLASSILIHVLHVVCLVNVKLVYKHHGLKSDVG